MVKNKTTTTQRGFIAEERACQYLLSLQYHLVTRNFSWRGGEIDLILLAPEKEASHYQKVGLRDLVFVEVRSSTERRSRFRYLPYSVHPQKQLRILKTIHQFFWTYKKYKGYPYRVDCIWVEGDEIEHWQNVWLCTSV